MERKWLNIFLLPFLLTSCGLGAKKIKNIVELTPKLSVESNEVIQIDSGIIIFNPEIFPNKEYAIARHKIIAEPVFNKNIIYTIDSKGNVSAFSEKTKSIIWSYNISINKDDNYIGGGILYHDDKLYVTYGSRYLVILDSNSGHEIIRKELPDIIRIGPVLINNHAILVQTVGNQLLAVNIDNLNFIWQHEGMIETLSSTYHASPIIHNDHVIVNYSSGQISALNANDGETLWTDDLSTQQEIGLPNFEATSLLCKPVINNSDIYIANSLGKIIKLDLNTGSIIWQIKAEDVQSMSLSGNSLFITNNAGQVVAINTNSGKVVFVADLLDQKNIRRVKAPIFLPPIIGKTGNNWSLNIISNQGQLYSFPSDDHGVLDSNRQVIKIAKNIGYYGKTCCDNIYFITDKKIIFESDNIIK